MKKILILLCMVCIVCFSGCGNKDSENSLNSATNLAGNQNEIKNNSVVNTESLTNEIENNSETNVNEDKNTTNTATNNANSSFDKDKVAKEENVTVTNNTDRFDSQVPKEDSKGITVLKFKNTNSDETIKALNGKKVSITGYLSTLSPLNGEFAYLMNMPYQSCPFCVPGTSAITNTLAIFAGNKDKIKFTDQPVTVIGTLETGNFTDEFGYEYGVRLNNVTVNLADVDELSDKVKQYNVLAESGVVSNIYNSIMTVDYSVFYDYYELEKPETIALDSITYTKNSLTGYNSKGEYNKLVTLMNNLVNLANTVNKDIEDNNYSNFGIYQNTLENLYYEFAYWMAEGEL